MTMVNSGLKGLSDDLVAQAGEPSTRLIYVLSKSSPPKVEHVFDKQDINPILIIYIGAKC